MRRSRRGEAPWRFISIRADGAEGVGRFLYVSSGYESRVYISTVYGCWILDYAVQISDWTVQILD